MNRPAKKKYLLTTLALVVLLGSVVPSGNAQETKTKQSIVWLLNDFPPFILLNGELPGSGFVDATVKYLVQHMPEFEHRFEVSGVARTQGLMAQGMPVCHPALLRTPEREKLAVFSNPVHFVLTHHVVLPSQHLQRFQAHIEPNGKINLHSLLADRQLSTSRTEGRSLGVEIDTALASHQQQPHLKTTGVHFDAPFRQLAAGWTDYVFAYPVEPSYYKKQGSIPAQLELSYLPIAGLKDYTLGSIACTKGTWGQAITARINAVIAQAGPRPPWVDAQIAYMDAPTVRHFERLLTRHNPFHAHTRP